VETKPRVSEFVCPIDGCGAEKETKKSYLIHLLMIHFNKEMETEYRDQFKHMNPKKCPECKMALLDNYLGFIKHLAVDHEVVVKYVKREEIMKEGAMTCVKADQSIISEVKEETTEEPVNDAESRSETPTTSDKTEPEPELPEEEDGSQRETANVDLRAILDSDSDSD